MYVCEVLLPIVHPVPANAGDYLVVAPGAEVPMGVVRETAGGWVMVRQGPPNFGAILPLLDDALRLVDEQMRPGLVALAA